MIPPNVQFWSNSRKKNVTSEQRHALKNGFLRKLLCSNDNFEPRYNRKTLIRERTSILNEVCFNNEQLFHLVQNTAGNFRQRISRDLIVLPEASGFF